ncbi:MAG: hypothetical protein PX482_07450, partial [Microcystis sp. M53602_WE12]|nr:hypothetical protein [Microcystis sp. M53602_WE12]
MKKFSPPQMKEVSFPTPHTPHPTDYCSLITEKPPTPDSSRITQDTDADFFTILQRFTTIDDETLPRFKSSENFYLTVE